MNTLQKIVLGAFAPRMDDATSDMSTAELFEGKRDIERMIRSGTAEAAERMFYLAVCKQLRSRCFKITQVIKSMR